MTRWRTSTTALVGIERYTIMHPGKSGPGQKYDVYRVNRRSIDMYSRTLEDHYVPVGSADTLEAAISIAEEHARDNQRE